jgi:hypothetical protein
VKSPKSGLGLLLLGEPKGKDSSTESGDDAANLAAKALLKAVRRDDADGVVAAFKQLRDSCEGHDDEADEDEAEDDDSY